MRSTWFIATLVTALSVSAASVGRLDSQPGVEEILAKMAQADEKRQAATKRYTATRQYSLKNDRFDREAGMIVEVKVAPATGKQFRVLSSTGSESVHSKVFRKLLEGEAEASRQGGPVGNRLCRENYDFELLGVDTIQGRSTYILELKPKHKSKYLIEGKAWVDSHDFQVVRLEGRPAASLSFWTGRPFLVCEFQKIHGLWLASQSKSHAKTKLLGSTNLTIDFTRYDLNSGNESLAAHSIN